MIVDPNISSESRSFCSEKGQLSLVEFSIGVATMMKPACRLTNVNANILFRVLVLSDNNSYEVGFQ